MIKLEEEFFGQYTDGRLLESIAVSLKRIADALESIEDVLGNGEIESADKSHD